MEILKVKKYKNNGDLLLSQNVQMALTVRNVRNPVGKMQNVILRPVNAVVVSNLQNKVLPTIYFAI